jgi:iron complex transport system substrate-binding protein
MVLPAEVYAAIEIIDRSGQTIVVKKPFKRIISLYPAHTENLFYLGLDEEIIGVSGHEQIPAKTQTKKIFSYREDPEKFIAARPDLVLIRPMIARSYANLIKKLRQAGITVVSLQPTSVEEIFDYWRKLAVLTGRSAAAEEMVVDFNRQLEDIRTVVACITVQSRKRVYFEAIHQKMKTFSSTSIASFALQEAGGINVAAAASPVRKTSNIAFYGKERILSHAGEIDVFLAQHGVMNRVTKEQIITEPGFMAIKAVANSNVYLVDEKIVSRPTMRLLQGIRHIGVILYPQLFR